MRVFLVLLTLLVVPACKHNNHDGALIYTSPCGLEVWGYGDDVAGAYTNPQETSDGLRWLRDGYGTWDELGCAMDDQVKLHIASHPEVDPNRIWTAARMVKYYLEDDYVFPDIGNPVDAAGTSYAAGETIQNPDDPARDIKIYLAVWTKNSTSTPWPNGTPSWTARAWNTAPLYTWGSKPFVPALSYELGWLDGVNPGAGTPVVQKASLR